MTGHVSPSLDLKTFLPYRLSVLTNKVSSNLARIYSEQFNLSIAEWRVMAVLGQQSDLSADEVCRETEMDKVTVSRAVTKMLEKDLLIRKFSETDKRRSMLRLSASGYAVYARIAPLALAYQEKLLACLDANEQQQLDGLLRKMDQQVLVIQASS